MGPEINYPLEPFPKMDFKAKLMGLVDANPRMEGIPGEETDQFKIGDGDFEIYEEPRGPCIKFTDPVKSRLLRPWRNAIIIKIMGKSHTHNFVLGRLQQRWSMLQGRFSLIDLENNFFIVKFALESDMKNILCGGPWIIAGLYVVMQKWRAGFDPHSESINRMAVWVRIVGLHIEWFNPEAMKRIGDLIGTTLRVDAHTASQVRGKYARVCVELDLTKPLIANVKVENCWYAVEYEGLHLICFNCGCYGHRREQCPSLIRKQSTTLVPDTETNQPMDEASVHDQVMSSNVGKPDKSYPTEVEKDLKLHDSPLIGPWSIVTYNRRAKLSNKSKLDQNDTKLSNSGSRFCSLVLEDVDPTTIDKAKYVHGKEHTMENTVGIEKKKQKRGRPRKALGGISNKEKGGSSGFNIGATSANLKLGNTSSQSPKSSLRKVNAKSRLATTPSNGVQVNGMDIQESDLGSFDFNVADPQAAYDAADKGIQNYGHEPPDIVQKDTDMSVMISLENGSLVNETMIDAQTGVVGASSSLVETGAGGKSFSVTAKDLFRLNRVNIFAILEPKISGERAIEVIKGLGFSNYYVVDANGFSDSVDVNGGVCLSLPSSEEPFMPYLDEVSAVSNMPWLIAGDFNELIHSSEKKGGRPINKNSGLGNWISRNSLVDLGFIGAKFTWSKKNEYGDFVWERLDKGLCNIAWRHLYSEAYVRHLAKVKSDHCPLHISLHSKHIPNPDLKAFRFQAMWMLHQEFEPFVNDTWNSAQGDASCKSFTLSSALQSWNHNVFGCIFQKKRRLLARICGIQKALCDRHVPYLFALENQLAKEYSTILEQEELFWLQKSRNTWLREGDKNTKFFHLSAVVRRRKNKLEGLNNSEGVWTDGKENLKSIVVNYFKDLFSFRITTTNMESLPHLFPCLSGDDLAVLNGEVTDDEIKDCMFSIGGLKAPGPDGIPARFYQKFWHLCGKDISDMVKGCFNSTQLPDNINNTFISLIPKVDNPTSMTQLRPISLCSTLYKWSFIRDILWEIGLRGKVLELIMQCVTTVKYQAIVNGELTDSFSPHCGIRQGDPLSPYLFVLCMEKLSHIINGCITTKKWKPVKLARNGPSVSHLFFADDLILFAEASSTQAKILKDCLDNFCAVSGQQVNFDKSCIYCSPNISRSKATEIANICGSPLTSDLGHYLGVPLLHSRVNKETYGNIVEKVQRRLSAWKSNTLSMAGRLVYLQSVASPIYSMQSTRLPISICDKIDKLNRNFLWGHTEGNSKVHLVKWETICTPKFMGWLGLKDTHVMNQALLAKTGWKLMQRDSGLWAQVLKGKYLKHHDMVGACSAKYTNCSHTWRGILFGAQILPNCMRWKVGSGS
ncbi:hypothetical protein ACFX2C_036031 [Malus domestica]